LSHYSLSYYLRCHGVPETQISEIDRTLPIFAMIGKTGVGKSSFIDKLGGLDVTGKHPGICHGLESCKIGTLEKGAGIAHQFTNSNTRIKKARIT
jgi:hypothetical protein